MEQQQEQESCILGVRLGFLNKSKTKAIDKYIKKDCHSEHLIMRTLMYENAKAANQLEAVASNRPLFHSPDSDGPARSTCDKQTNKKNTKE